MGIKIGNLNLNGAYFGDKTIKIYVGNDLVYPIAYTITFSIASGSNASWEHTSLVAYKGDVISKSNNTITCYVGSTSNVRWTNTATPSPATAQWSYSISSITTPTSPVSANQTLTATTTTTERIYAVQFKNGTYGSWSGASLFLAPYSATITKSGMVVSVNGQSNTYNLNSDLIYNYSTTINNASGIVGTGKTITTTDTRSVKSYTLTLDKKTNVASVSMNRTQSPYASASIGALSNGATLYYGDKLSGSATGNEGYSVSPATYSNSGVKANVIYSPTASAKTYSITKSATNGTLSVATSGTFNSNLSISWSPSSTSGYVYEFDYVRVYSGSSTSGTLLATYTSGTSATFKMSGTYYSSIYVVLNYKKYQWVVFSSSYGWVLSTSSTTLSNMYGSQSLYTDIMRLSGTYKWSIAGHTYTGNWSGVANGGSFAISSSYGTAVITIHFSKSGGTTSMTAYYSRGGATSGTMTITTTTIEYKKYS